MVDLTETGPAPGRDGSAATLRGFADTTEFALLSIDGQGLISFVNKAAERMFGYAAGEMIGQTLDLIIPKRMRGAHTAGVARVASGQASKLDGKTVEVAALRRDGSEFPIELSLSVWHGPKGVAMGGLIRDISEKREREARLHRLAHHDSLTGLPNGTQFNQWLDAILASGRRVAVLLLGIEGLKRVNDNLGHLVGDTLLQALAVRLPSVLRADAFLARLGGDEFAVLLSDVADSNDAVGAAAALVESFEAAFNVGDYFLQLGVGIGMAFGPDDGKSAEELIACADLALTQARQDGEKVRTFDSQMRHAVLERRRMKDELRQAVETGELVLHYQPQVDLRTGAVFGAEALLRWRHPARGLLLPGSFLPVLESHSLALQVGCWILDEACRQAAAWRASAFPDLRVSVNLFAAQVTAGNLPEMVMDTLARHRLPPDALEIEVTETIVLDTDDKAIAPFWALRANEVRIAFDDFGTGHASLSTLKRFPLTTLKIDRGFVHDVLAEPTDAAIVQALLGMGRGMGLDVIAEGIETPEQRAMLLTMGCRYGQGFLYGRALAPDDFARAAGVGLTLARR